MLTVSSLISSSLRRAVQRRADAAPAVVDHVLELVAEVLQEALHRPCGRVAERTDRMPFDLVRDVHQDVEIGARRLAFGDPREHPIEPAGAVAARRALAAGVRGIEPLDPPQHAYLAG